MKTAKSRSEARQRRIVLTGMNIARWPRKSQKWVWGILAALAGIGAAGVALWQVPWWLDAHYLPTITQPQATAVTGVRTALLAMGAGGLAAVGILYTHRTLHQNREGQVTDRYTKAIGQIASDRPVEQLGGIYALERIMRDSAKDHATIVEVLAAFVREHATPLAEPSTQERLRLARQRLRASAPAARGLRGHAAEGNTDPRPTEPVQAALTVLARRPPGRDEPFQLNLARTDLRGAHLGGAHLERANLARTDLRGANLHGAHLERANLGGAHLERAYLGGAHLEDAYLYRTHLETADLYRAHLERAYLGGAHLEGADLYGAHLETANLDDAQLEGALKLTVEQLLSAWPNQNTGLPAHLANDGRVMARIAAVKREERRAQASFLANRSSVPRDPLA